MDLDLDESQRILVDTFREMLEQECPPSHVRACEETGFSKDLWACYSELGANVMGLPEASGGLGMELLDLGLVATQSGRALAPVPFVDVAVAGRLLARLDADDPLIAEITQGVPSVSVCLPRPHAVRGTGTSVSTQGVAQSLVSFGAIAEHVVAFEGDEIFVVSDVPRRRSNRTRDLGDGALAYWDLSRAGNDLRSLASGPRVRAERLRANAEWKLLAAFWLMGIAQRALEIGAEYARERQQFGVAIGGFQAIAHPLAECAIRVDGAELLCWEAAWADKEDPARFEMLCSMAFAWAAATALRTADISLHTHGGYGFSTEYDIQLYYRRARALASIGGGPKEELQAIAEFCFDSDGSGRAAALLGGA